MARAVLLLASVLAAHYGYALLHDPIARRWTFYVLRGLEGCVMALMLIPRRADGAPARHARAAHALQGFAAALAFIEEAQTSVCGVAEWRTEVADDLCMAWLGGHAFAAIAAGAIATLIVWKGGSHG